jgi:hypothetical protein
MTPDFEGFWFFAIKIFFAKLKVGVGCLGAHMDAYNVFLEKFYSFGFFMNV